MPMPCIENAKYDNPKAIWCSTRQIGVNLVLELSCHNSDARDCHYQYHPPPKVIINSPIYANSVHIEWEIWQSVSNPMLFEMLWSTFYIRICSIKNLTRYHQPPKVIIRSPHMPTLCIDNAKYDIPQVIWCKFEMLWSRLCVGICSIKNLTRKCQYGYHYPLDKIQKVK
jgi:hypothetical protein